MSEVIVYKCMSAFRYAAFSGWNWTVVHGHSSVWFVFAGMNTVIALGCRPKKKCFQKRKRSPPWVSFSKKGIQTWLSFGASCLLFIFLFNYLFNTGSNLPKVCLPLPFLYIWAWNKSLFVLALSPLHDPVCIFICLIMCSVKPSQTQ